MVRHVVNGRRMCVHHSRVRSGRSGQRVGRVAAVSDYRSSSLSRLPPAWIARRVSTQ